MVNKRGWIRIIEVSIAILLIFSVLVIVNQTSKNAKNEFNDEIRSILSEIAENTSLRDKVIGVYDINKNKTTAPNLEVMTSLENVVLNAINENYVGYAIEICRPNDLCGLASYPNVDEVYSEERIISSDLSKYNPRKIKIYLWIK
jgi:hypothetical protein